MYAKVMRINPPIAGNKTIRRRSWLTVDSMLYQVPGAELGYHFGQQACLFTLVIHLQIYCGVRSVEI